MSSPSPSDPPGLDRDAPLPGTWTVVAVLALAHVLTGWWLWTDGVDPVGAWLIDRTAEQRVSLGGQVAARIPREPWRLVTSVSLHASGLHLVLNLVGLAALGRMVEPWVGSVRLVSWFLLGGLAGSVVPWLTGVLRSDGASGGAFALLGAAAVLGFRARHRLDPQDRKLYGPVLQGFVVLNVALSLVVPVVDAAGHLGGLAAGALLALLPGHRWTRGLEAALAFGLTGVLLATAMG